MTEVIQDDKLVELTYKVTDQATGQVLTSVEFPLGYIHGHNDVLAPQVLKELEGKAVGDVIEVPIDCNLLYGPRDETLVFILEVLSIRDATDEEIEAGGPELPESDVDAGTKVPI